MSIKSNSLIGAITFIFISAIFLCNILSVAYASPPSWCNEEHRKKVTEFQYLMECSPGPSYTDVCYDRKNQECTKVGYSDNYYYDNGKECICYVGDITKNNSFINANNSLIFIITISIIVGIILIAVFFFVMKKNKSRNKDNFPF